MPDSVDVCVATFRRPRLLAQLLVSLAEQTARGLVAFRIIVVDNDVKRSAESTVEAFRNASGMEVVYDVAPTQGISHARNLALRHAVASLVAFIDDDEEADAEWLAHLLKALDLHGAHVVFGPVTAILPESAPRWAGSHPAFCRPRRKSGADTTSGGAGNVIFRRELLQYFDRWFDSRYARTGGEDTEFFSRIHARGFRLVWSDEAEVKEHVPTSRLTFRWVCKRAFRGGQTYYRIFIADRTLCARVSWLSKRAAASLSYLLLLPFLAVGSGQFVARVCRLCGWIGQLSQMFGRRFEYEEYRID